MIAGLLFAAAFLAPAISYAHEVYVLPVDTITSAIAQPAFSEWNVILTNIDQFLLWAFVAGLVIFSVFFISISRSLENRFDPLLEKLPPYAPLVGRVTLGLALIAGAHYDALFGPELPLYNTFGIYADSVQFGLYVLGIMIIAGLYARIAATFALTLFAFHMVRYGTYMLTYANYAGELFLILLLGAHVFAFHGKVRDEERSPRWFLIFKEVFAKHGFFILRFMFGTSLIYSSIYAKIIHNQLALHVAYEYPQLVAFFGFEPHFLVLGAAIVEIVLGLMFILGLEIRFASLFLLFWLSLSLWYFGESVWPHLILIGIPIAFIFYGYDTYSLEGRFFKHDGREPVL